MKSLAVLAPVFGGIAYAQSTQPLVSGTGPGTFEIIGTSGVSAQQLFLGTDSKVYIVDKIENNPLQVNGHPAWASEYNLLDNKLRAMDVVTNTFCAGGNVLGDGRWINIGGNQNVAVGGVTANSSTGNPYQGADGRFAVRFLTPCDDGTCEWNDDPKNYIKTERWYPTLETLEDGSVIIIGGNTFGGFVSATDNNNPTYEFYPKRGDGKEITLNFLLETLPANLYPLTWLLPSGVLWMTTNWATQIFDYKNGVEHPGPAMPHAVRTYPGSAANSMLPMTPANNWTATMVFCGGTDLQKNQWRNNVVVDVPASASCVRISPDVSSEFEEDDDLPDGRTMGNFIILPDGKFWLGNGVNTGVAGYGNDSWAVGHSYADDPLMTPLIYDPAAPKGSRFSSAGLQASQVPRLYHSAATLLPDGSVFVSGSNPNPDVTDQHWGTEYRVERWYPDYYQKRRPEPAGLPEKIGYGGPYFNLTLSAADLGSDATKALGNTQVVLMRTGFSTHAINFGMKYVQLNNTYTLDASGSATLHVSQVPPNPAILAPGPAWVFVVVDGVPSIGKNIMVGSGKIETQTVTAAADLPGTYAPSTAGGNGGSGNGGNGGGSSSAAGKVGPTGVVVAVVMALAGGIAALI